MGFLVHICTPVCFEDIREIAHVHRVDLVLEEPLGCVRDCCATAVVTSFAVPFVQPLNQRTGVLSVREFRLECGNSVRKALEPLELGTSVIHCRFTGFGDDTAENSNQSGPSTVGRRENRSSQMTSNDTQRDCGRFRVRQQERRAVSKGTRRFHRRTHRRFRCHRPSIREPYRGSRRVPLPGPLSR